MSDNSKKPLLEEATIRRFQTLANLGTLGEGPMSYARDDEDEFPPRDVQAGGEELPLDDEPPAEEELPGEDEFPAEDDLEAGLSPEAQALADVIAEPVTTAVAQAISDSPDIDVEVSEEPGVEEVPGVEEPAEPGVPGPEEEEEDELDLALEQLEAANVEVVDREKLVSEIARRVAKRLLKRR